MTHNSGNKQSNKPNRQTSVPNGRAQLVNEFPKAEEKKASEAKTDTSQYVWDNNWSRADKIAAWSVSVNAILAIVTFLLFMLTRESNKSAIKSANAAVTADSLSKVNYDTTFALQKAINRPYLQFHGFTFTQFAVNMPIKYVIRLKNFGNEPIQIISKQIRVFPYEFPHNVGHDSLVAHATKETTLNYIDKDGVELNEETNVMVDYPMEFFYKKTEFRFYIFGNIEYINLLTNEKSIYKFNARVIKNTSHAEPIYLLF